VDRLSSGERTVRAHTLSSDAAAGLQPEKDFLMPQTNTFARSLHEIGLASWFGGSLMGAVGLNGAAAQVDDPRQRARVANAGWDRWTPVNAAGIGAHLLGGAVLTAANKARLATQPGVATATGVKLGLQGAALAATAYSRVLGHRIKTAGDVPVDGGTTPGSGTPPDVASAQRQLAVLQWVIPALTGAQIVVNAVMGEQQRPKSVAAGLIERARGVPPWAVAPVALAAVALVARSRRQPGGSEPPTLQDTARPVIAPTVEAVEAGAEPAPAPGPLVTDAQPPGPERGDGTPGTPGPGGI
jgi:hypothetical protein